MIRNGIRIIFFLKHFWYRKSLMIVLISRKRFLSYLTKNCKMLRQKEEAWERTMSTTKLFPAVYWRTEFSCKKNRSWWANDVVPDRKSDWEAKHDICDWTTSVSQFQFFKRNFWENAWNGGTTAVRGKD